MSGFYKFQTFRSFISRLCGFHFFAQRVSGGPCKLVQTLYMNGSGRDIENKRINRTLFFVQILSLTISSFQLAKSQVKNIFASNPVAGVELGRSAAWVNILTRKTKFPSQRSPKKEAKCSPKS